MDSLCVVGGVSAAGSTAKPYPHQVTGQVQMTCGPTTLDLHISPDK